jgi:predicted dehydrogenase
MESLNEIRWGIIGCGDVCEVKSGPAFNKVAHSRLVAVMRRDGLKAKDYALRNNVPKYYDDAARLIADPEINAIYIATPPDTHESYAIAAMKAGKPLYIEKPVTLDSASCERLIRACEQYNMRVSVAHYRRGLPIFQKIKFLVETGALGNVSLIVANTLQAPNHLIGRPDNWRVNPAVSGGGLFHDLSPHQLDIFYWIFGQPEEVRGRSINQRGLYEAPDLTTLDAIFKNNILLRGTWAFNLSPAAEEETCMIIGDKGKITFSFFVKSDIEMKTSSATERLTFDYPVNIQQPMIQAVVNFFRGEGANPCSLHDALVTMKMIDRSVSVNQ